MTLAGPGGSPGAARRVRWWSPAPVPPSAPTISARRAYVEAIGVYLVFFGPSIVAAAGSLANYNEPNPEGWWITGPNVFQEVAQAVVAVVVVLLLAERRGRRPAQVGLALRRKGGGPGAHQAIRMAAWAAVAFLAGSVVTSILATGNFPFGHESVANTVLDLSAAANAGVTEEIVVLAFLVTTLEQARRPRLEIAAVALVCRGAYHIYYGPGAIGILVWAGVFLWLFWRFRSVVPMIITHICWDTLVFLTRVSDAFGVVLILGILGLGITAIVLWLVDRSERPVQGPVWVSGPWNSSPAEVGTTGPPWAAGPSAPWGNPAPSSAPPPTRTGWTAPGWGPPAPADGEHRS
jgi:hypothetical protein